MAKLPPLALDDNLTRLGREWFAELRQRDRAEAKSARSRGGTDATVDASGGLLDWLFGESPDACHDPSDADGGDGDCGE